MPRPPRRAVNEVWPAIEMDVHEPLEDRDTVTRVLTAVEGTWLQDGVAAAAGVRVGQYVVVAQHQDSIPPRTTASPSERTLGARGYSEMTDGDSVW